VLVCNHTEAASQVLKSLEGYTNPASQMRLIRMHGRGDLNVQQLHASNDWQQTVDIIQEINQTPWLEMDV
ncbi:MAG TPA: beta-N-acetylhexosaminidase, partial [Gammaproteobacteria bacterium]